MYLPRVNGDFSSTSEVRKYGVFMELWNKRTTFSDRNFCQEFFQNTRHSNVFNISFE